MVRKKGEVKSQRVQIIFISSPLEYIPLPYLLASFSSLPDHISEPALFVLMSNFPLLPIHSFFRNPQTSRFRSDFLPSP